MDFAAREFPSRNVYVVVDGQDLLAGCDDPNDPHAAGESILKFTFIEVNTRLCRMIPQKTWESKAAQRLNFHKKIELAKPS